MASFDNEDTQQSSQQHNGAFEDVDSASNGVSDANISQHGSDTLTTSNSQAGLTTGNATPNPVRPSPPNIPRWMLTCVSAHGNEKELLHIPLHPSRTDLELFHQLKIAYQQQQSLPWRWIAWTGVVRVLFTRVSATCSGLAPTRINTVLDLRWVHKRTAIF